MSVRVTEQYYKPIQKELEAYFYELYWKRILEIVKDPEVRQNARQQNAKTSALIAAIRSGRVQYKSGVFTGSFNITISKELSAFAKYDGIRKVWRGQAPGNVIAASVVANDKGRKTADRIKAEIAKIPSYVETTIGEMSFPIKDPLFRMSREAEKDMASLGLRPVMTEELSGRLIEEYTTNMNLNIKDWSGNQVERLRDMIEKNALGGYNRQELERLIKSEYGTTMAKAKFLARQETSLFATTVRDERYKEAGVKYVRWSSSKDARVVGDPSGKYPDPSPGHGDHFFLQGKICRLDDPSVYADSIEDAKANKWKSKATIPAESEHAGRAYGCRCTYIPLVL